MQYLRITSLVRVSPTSTSVIVHHVDDQDLVWRLSPIKVEGLHRLKATGETRIEPLLWSMTATVGAGAFQVMSHGECVLLTRDHKLALDVAASFRLFGCEVNVVWCEKELCNADQS